MLRPFCVGAVCLMATRNAEPAGNVTVGGFAMTKFASCGGPILRN